MSATPRNAKLSRLICDKEFRKSEARRASLELDRLWRALPKKRNASVDVIDFFSGCGGMSAGFLATNAIAPIYNLAMAVDLDRDANETYARNIGVQPQPLDVAHLAQRPRQAADLIRKYRTSAKTPLVLIGCAPCQGFSSHRNASGQTDLRNSLFVSFAKIAVEVGPDVIIMENVPEILSDRYWPLVAESRKTLEKAGYVSRIIVHDMAEFGVPQQRFRALMIAMKRPFIMPSGFLSRGNYRTVRDAIGNLPKVQPGETCPNDPMHYTAGHRASTVETIMAVPLNGGSRPWHVGPECLRRAAAKQGRAAYEDVYGRLWWDRPAITVTAYARNPASGRYVHPEQHRGLSIREAALLQGFPRDYVFCGGFDSRFRQIGNAVPPAFAAFLAVHLIGELFRRKGATVHEDLDRTDIIGSIGPSFSRLIPSLKAGHRKIAAGTAEAAAMRVG